MLEWVKAMLEWLRSNYPLIPVLQSSQVAIHMLKSQATAELTTQRFREVEKALITPPPTISQYMRKMLAHSLRSSFTLTAPREIPLRVQPLAQRVICARRTCLSWLLEGN
jgi:hypothetical protein